MKLENVFNHLLASAVCIDEKGIILAVNRQWTHFAQIGSASVELMNGVGLNYLEVCDKAARASSEYARLAAQGIREVIAGERSFFEMEYICYAPNAQQWTLFQMFPLSADSGQFLILHIPVTSTKQLATELRHQQKLTSLGLLASGIAHDINNFLQILSFQLSMIRRKSTDVSPISSNLESATLVLGQMASLAHQMRVYSGQGETSPELVDLNSVIEDNLALIQACTYSSSAELITNLQTNLPSIVVNRSTILEMILNLVLDAVEATRGIPTARVFISTSDFYVENEGDVVDTYTQKEIPVGHYLLLSIEDNSGDPPSSIINSIFDLSFTGKSGTRGQGLAMASAIVNDLNGAIQVVQEIDKCTQFRIYLSVPKEKCEQIR